jgi:hypothetical protein
VASRTTSPLARARGLTEHSIETVGRLCTARHVRRHLVLDYGRVERASEIAVQSTTGVDRTHRLVGQRNCCCLPRERFRGKAPRRSFILATTRPTRTTTRRPAATTSTTALAPRRPSRRRAKRRSVAGGWSGGREGATRTPDRGEHQQHRQYQPAQEGAGQAAVGAETQHDRR